MTPVAPGTTIENVQVIEAAGSAERFYLYFGARDTGFVWLFQSFDGAPPFTLPDSAERFQARGQTWYVVALARLPVSEITRHLARVELAYWGWRWVVLTRSITLAHQRGAVWRAGNAFGLNYLSFGSDGELLFSQGHWDTAPEYAFLPPEGNDATTPASDVYSLGASLRALLGASLTPQVRQVLNRATDANPGKRYPDAKAFAEALSAALPAPKRAAAAKPAKRTPTWMLAAGALLLLICLVAGVILIPPQLNQALPVSSPEPTDIIAKLTTEVRDWQVGEGCNAVLQLRVLIGDQPPGPNNQVRFLVSKDAQQIQDVNQASSSDRADQTLTFNAGDVCARGGQVTVQTQTIGQKVTHVLYYYPNMTEESSFSGLRLGTIQVVTIRHPRLRVYFGFTDASGVPRRVRGALRVYLWQDNFPVNQFTFAPVDPTQDPLTAVLVLDTSGSMKGEAMARAQQAAIQFVKNLNPNDRACIYRFATQVDVVQECTTDRNAAIRALETLTAEGGTALYDGIVQVSAAHIGKPERQAIIVLSDGDDTTSNAKLEQALEQSARTNVPIYTIGLINKDLQPDILRQIAERNGGTYLEAPGPEQLAGLYANINAGLANQYQIDFDSPFPDRKDGTIEISISNGAEEINFSRSFIVE